MFKQLWEILFESLWNKNNLKFSNTMTTKNKLDIDCIDKFKDFKSKLAESLEQYDYIDSITVEATVFRIQQYQKLFDLVVEYWGNMDLNTEEGQFMISCRNLSEYCNEIVGLTKQKKFGWL
jgi:hypothetical protein